MYNLDFVVSIYHPKFCRLLSVPEDQHPNNLKLLIVYLEENVIQLAKPISGRRQIN